MVSVNYSIQEHSAPVYKENLNSQEKSHLAYIIKTLAHGSVFTLLGEKGNLEKRGEAINHIDSLSFLLGIFKNPQIKADFKHLAKKKGIIWNQFIGKMSQDFCKKSVSEENKKSFATQLNVNYVAMKNLSSAKDWKKFITHFRPCVVRLACIQSSHKSTIGYSRKNK